MLSIDGETGDVLVDGVRLGRSTSPKEWRRVAKLYRDFPYPPADRVSFVVAAGGDLRIGLVVDTGQRRLQIDCFREGDSWDNWSIKKMEAHRDVLVGLLRKAGLERMPNRQWGRAAIVYDDRNTFYHLELTYT